MSKPDWIDLSRIEDGTVTGTATITRAYAIGRHTCRACKVETPHPPQAVLDDLAYEKASISTVWPFEHWRPAGWMDIREYGHICPACVRAVMNLLESRDPATDLAIVDGNIARALEIALPALDAGFPGEPEGQKDLEPWSHAPQGMRRQYFRESKLRETIRAIRDALMGTK